MKALSIKNPMAVLIAMGIKPIENRTRITHFRGRIYIHVSAKYMDSNFLDEYINTDRFIDMSKKLKSIGVLEKDERIADFLKKQPISAIIGEVDIVDCVVNHPSIWADKTPDESDLLFCRDCADNDGICPNDNKKCDEPKVKPIYNWVLANPVLYEKPILNVKGKLSFWETDYCHCEACQKPFHSEAMVLSEDNWICEECLNKELSQISEL